MTSAVYHCPAINTFASIFFIRQDTLPTQTYRRPHLASSPILNYGFNNSARPRHRDRRLPRTFPFPLLPFNTLLSDPPQHDLTSSPGTCRPSSIPKIPHRRRRYQRPRTSILQRRIRAKNDSSRSISNIRVERADPDEREDTEES